MLKNSPIPQKMNTSTCNKFASITLQQRGDTSTIPRNVVFYMERVYMLKHSTLSKGARSVMSGRIVITLGAAECPP